MRSGRSRWLTDLKRRRAMEAAPKLALLAWYSAFSAGLRRPSLSTTSEPAKRFSSDRPTP